MPTNVLGSAVVQIDVKLTGMDQLSALHGALGRVAAAKGVSQRLSAIGVAAGQAGQQLRQLSFVLRDAGRQFLAFGGILAAGLFGITKVTASFEQSIANTKAVISELADGTPEASVKLARLSQTILDVAASSRYTATEVAAAAEQLGLAGFRAIEVQQSLAGVTNLAAAGAIELARAAEITANAIRAWGLSASQAARVADVLAVAATNSNNTITTLGEGLKLVSATASLFGISIEETTTALALLGDAGLKGSIGGTSLNRLLLQLGSSSNKLAALLKKVGKTQDDIDPLKHSLEDILAVFRDLLSTGKVTETQLAAAFDIRAFRSLGVLAKTSAEAFDEMSQKLKTAAGEAENIANIKLDTVQGAFLLLKSVIEVLVVTIGETFQDELKVLIRQFKETVTRTVDWVKANKELIASWIKTIVQVSLFTLAVGAAFTIVGSLLAVVASFILLVGAMATAMAIFATSTIAADIAWKSLMASLIIGTGFVYLLVVAIGILSLGLFTLLKWITGVGTEAAETESNFEEMAAAASKLGYEIDAVSTALSRQISAQQRLNEILSKGSNITEKELKEIPELLLNGASLDRDELEADMIDATTQIEKHKNEIESIFDTGGKQLSAKAQERVRILNQQITQQENLIKGLQDSIEEFDKTDLRSKFEEFENQGGGSNKKFKQFLKEKNDLAQKAAEDLNKEIKNGDRQDDRPQALAQLETLRKEAELAKSQLNLADILFDPASFEAFVNAIRAGVPVGEELKAAFDVKSATNSLVEYNNTLKETQEEALKVREALDKDVENFVGAGVESKFEEAERLRDELASQTGEFISKAIVIANNDITLLGGTFLQKAQNTAKILAQLGVDIVNAGVKLAQQQKDIDNKREELLNEQLDKQKTTLRSSQKKKAEADKDIKTLEKIIREERKDALQKELEEGGFILDPEAKADAAQLAESAKRRAEFEKNYNEETEKDIQNRKDQFAADAARLAAANKKQKATTQNSTERLAVEKDITSELIKQVKTFEDAARAIQFARNVQKQRERDAKTALRDQGHQEQRLLELQERRNELAKKGQDTTRLDRQLALNRRLLGLTEGFADNAAEDAGNSNKLGGSKLLEQFDKVEVDSVKLLEDAKAKVAFAKSVVNVFEAITTQFKLAPEGWAKALIDSWNNSISGFNPQLPNPNQGQDGQLAAGNPALPTNVPGARIPGLPGNALAQAPAIGTQNNTDNRNINIEINGVDANPQELATSILDKISRQQFS